MIDITKTSEYTLYVDHDRSECVEIHDCESLNLRIETADRTHAQLWIAYDGTQMSLDVQIALGCDSELTVLFWNRLNDALKMRMHIGGKSGSHALISIGDLQDGDGDYHIQADMNAVHSDVELTSVCMAAHKHWHVDFNHHQPHTTGLMHHFAVVEENGDYLMEASGRIDKGAYEAESHQSSRVLTMAQKQRSEVQPILYIDENNVKASHATTLGQPDEAQLYYLQSRGLSRSMALGLLRMGYLMPIVYALKHEEWQRQLQQEIEEKVIRHD